MRRIHLVYPHGSSISAPNTIGRHLAELLRRNYLVIQYNWDEVKAIVPKEGDILLGHPHPAPWTVFRKSLAMAGWSRIIALAPYAHGDLVQMAWADAIIPQVDLFLAITGRHWFRRIDQSAFAHWLPKMIHLDLAVDRTDFPIIKDSFNPPGSRKFIYIGHSKRFKNVGYLSAIAAQLPDMHFSRAGRGKAVPGLEPLGTLDFASEAGRVILAQHDFLITVGYTDANPTTILEAMAWGLIPVCSPQSGYEAYRGIVNVPLDDLPGAVAILNDLQYMPEARLLDLQRENWRQLDKYFNWERFASQVIDAIESDASPSVLRHSRTMRWRLRLAALRSPYSPLGARNLRLLMKSIEPGWCKNERRVIG